MTTIKIRRGQSGTGTGKWGTINPTLAAGEFGLETDTGKLKIGDGTTAWNSLTYIADGSKITGTTLASNVVSSSLTSVGTLSNLTVTNTITGSVSGSAARIAGGAAGKLVVQSGSGTTTFTDAPSHDGQLLKSSLSSPYGVWVDPIPYKIATGKIASGDWSSGVVTVTFTGVTFTQAPIVLLTPIAANTSSLTVVSLSSTTAVSTTGFTANARTYNGSSFTNGAPTTHWIAIQYASDSAVSQ